MTYVECRIVYRTQRYVAFWAIYTDGTMALCFSDCLEAVRQSPGYHGRTERVAARAAVETGEVHAALASMLGDRRGR